MSGAPPPPAAQWSILHVVAPAPVGGLERVVRALAAGQAAAGHRVTVAAILDEAGQEISHPFVASFANTPVSVVPVMVGRRGYWRERSAVRVLAGQRAVDILHTHGRRPDVIDSGVARARGVPGLTTVHGFTGDGWRTAVYAAMQRHAFRRLDAVVAVSESVATALVRFGAPAARVHVIPNAYLRLDQPLERAAARARLGLGKSDYVVGWVGRLSREKGMDVLLAALEALGDCPLTVVVLGTGPERGALEAAARRVRATVRWAGLVPDASRLYRAFDLFVLSSRTEGTPIALFEAMDAEVPVVATAVGGVPVVVTEEGAVLVQPEDPPALARAIRTSYDDPAGGRARAVVASRRLLESYGVGPWLAAYDHLYETLMAEGCGRRRGPGRRRAVAPRPTAPT